MADGQSRSASFFETLTATTRRLVEGLQDRARQAGIPLAVNAVGGMFGMFFTGESSVTTFAGVMAAYRLPAIPSRNRPIWPTRASGIAFFTFRSAWP